ncbi:MAG: type IX secretion system outer membrane channel protein PorV [Alloprevotella sp.]|nr:type IX secretion system outer membrane channel protein PorV [Alloprevotella sp.]
MNKHIFFIAALFALPAFADDGDELRDNFNPVMTAVTSQSIAPDARSGGLGDIGAASDPDVNSQAWNPAKYPFTISRAGLALNYTPWLRQLTDGIALLNATGYLRLGDYQALSASLNYFTVGEVYLTSGNSAYSEAVSDFTVKPYEFSVDVAYSRMLSETFSAAVALRYMYSDMSGHSDDNMKPGSAFAADIAGYWNKYIMLGQRECLLAFGFNVRNIGSKINYGSDDSYFIPTNLRIGGNLTVPINEYNKISFMADANRLLVPAKPLQGADEGSEEYEQRLRDDYYDLSAIKGIGKSFSGGNQLDLINWSAGLEYTYNDKFSLRGGYHNESKSQGGRCYFTVGAGFRMNVMSIDAGYVIATNSTNPLDQTLRVSLAFDFDGIRDLFGRR